MLPFQIATLVIIRVFDALMDYWLYTMFITLAIIFVVIDNSTNNQPMENDRARRVARVRSNRVRNSRDPATKLGVKSRVSFDPELNRPRSLPSSLELSPDMNTDANAEQLDLTAQNKFRGCICGGVIFRCIESRGVPVRTPYIIGVAGASGSGKSYISNVFVQAIKGAYPNMKDSVAIINQDSYYRGGDVNTNYDVPDSIDFELLCQHLTELIRGNAVHTPTYDFSTHSRGLETKVVKPCRVIIVEGILVLTQKPLLDIFDLKIFINADVPTQIFRRTIRDIKDRGRDIDEVHTRFERDVWPSYKKYVEPSVACADVTITSTKDSYVGPEVIVSYIMSKIDASIRPHNEQNI